MSTESERIAQLEAAQAVFRTEIGNLKDQAATRRELAELLEPIRKEQALQSTSIIQLSKNMEILAETGKKTNEVVQGVLKTYNDDILSRAQAWGLSNVVRMGAVVFGSVAGLTTLGTLIYAAIKFISKLP